MLHADLPFDAEWGGVGEITSKELYPLMVLSGPGIKGSTKLAGFDIDTTLIVPKSGRKFGTGPSDWKLMQNVKEKLTAIHKDGFKVILFTNQRGLEKGYSTPADFQKKVTAIIKELAIPIQVFVATGENHYRKPYTNMWDYMVDNENDDIKPDLQSCYYVGDAAGRPKNWAPGKPRDFSCSDRKFAANIGIQFYTPEEFFLGENPVAFDWGTCDPNKILQEAKSDMNDTYHSKDKELIIMVGPPASGKSSFARQYLVPHGYVQVNRDTLKTPAKCLAATKAAIKEGKSVVIDNTNPSVSARADYIYEASKADYQIRCFLMTTPMDLAHHLNYVRQAQTESKVRRVPDVGYNVYKKNHEKPDKEEGFDDILEIPFVPTFDNDKEKALFLQWMDG
ncbi:bifunctional polynucleotide phosphatase/kinase-like isoform X2 [Amphiura filiformis]|uniref:bifunctional polynucleotide phosphatase/kinase-like isoform X2 n=1 Tax=Amphiura filiformis TaxID=82378 RepID=UPI003B22012D